MIVIFCVPDDSGRVEVETEKVLVAPECALASSGIQTTRSIE